MCEIIPMHTVIIFSSIPPLSVSEEKCYLLNSVTWVIYDDVHSIFRHPLATLNPVLHTMFPLVSNRAARDSCKYRRPIGHSIEVVHLRPHSQLFRSRHHRGTTSQVFRVGNVGWLSLFHPVQFFGNERCITGNVFPVVVIGRVTVESATNFVLNHFQCFALTVGKAWTPFCLAHHIF